LSASRFTFEFCDTSTTTPTNERTGHATSALDSEILLKNFIIASAPKRNGKFGPKIFLRRRIIVVVINGLLPRLCVKRVQREGVITIGTVRVKSVDLLNGFDIREVFMSVLDLGKFSFHIVSKTLC